MQYTIAKKMYFNGQKCCVLSIWEVLTMVNSDDRRVRKTRRLMTDALAKLLAEKPLSNITVREIADMADINRGTFYLHYKDVFDMVDKIQADLFEKFNAIITNYMPTADSKRLFPLLEKLFELLAENANLARALVSKHGDAAFINKLKNVVREKCLADMPNPQPDKAAEFDYFFSYVSSGCTGLCHAWLEGDMAESPAEMAALAERFIKGSFDATVRH